MSAIKLNSSGGGSITISPASTASNLTLTAPAQTGTIGLDGPAFRAYATTTQNVTNAVNTKVTFGTESFDTNNNFASSRFTPTVAGYYQINAVLRGGATSGLQAVVTTIYKNGAPYGTSQITVTSTPYFEGCSISDVVYCNGSTDYIEIYGAVFASSGPIFHYDNDAITSYFSGCMVRAA